jgi:hypothetical protein
MGVTKLDINKIKAEAQSEGRAKGVARFGTLYIPELFIGEKEINRLSQMESHFNRMMQLFEDDIPFKLEIKHQVLGEVLSDQSVFDGHDRVELIDRQVAFYPECDAVIIDIDALIFWNYQVHMKRQHLMIQYPFGGISISRYKLISGGSIKVLLSGHEGWKIKFIRFDRS